MRFGLLSTSALLFLAVTEGVVRLPVRVILLRDPNGQMNSDPPYYEEGGTLPLDSDGSWTFPKGQSGSLGTSITQQEVATIFEAVNDYFEPTKVEFEVEKIIEASPAVPCGTATEVCGVDDKCRTLDYLVRYFGRMDKTITRDGRGERPAVLHSMFPDEHERIGMMTMVYMKYMGKTSQGFALTRGSSRRAHCGQWSDKFTPQQVVPRPVVDGSIEGLGLAYTTAHELGHLFGIGHTPEKSLMGGGGSAFSDNEINIIKQFVKSNINSLNGTWDRKATGQARGNGRPNKICKLVGADPCANVHCGAGGSCVLGDCVCDSGFSGDRCQTVYEVTTDTAVSGYGACGGKQPYDEISECETKCTACSVCVGFVNIVADKVCVYKSEAITRRKTGKNFHKKKSESTVFFAEMNTTQYIEDLGDDDDIDVCIGVDCGGNGECDNSGKCVCFNGFQGAQCENDAPHAPTSSGGGIFEPNSSGGGTLAPTHVLAALISAIAITHHLH